MAEPFVKTFKRGYVRVNQSPNAAAASHSSIATVLAAKAINSARRALAYGNAQESTQSWQHR
jgi:hypothetical protein